MGDSEYCPGITLKCANSPISDQTAAPLEICTRREAATRLPSAPSFATGLCEFGRGRSEARCRDAGKLCQRVADAGVQRTVEVSLIEDRQAAQHSWARRLTPVTTIDWS